MKNARRNLVAADVLFLIASLLILGSPRAAVAQQRVSVAQARARISRHIAHIEERKKKMADTYYNYNNAAAKTLEAAFRENGITSSMGYAQSWGTMGVGLTWSQSAERFYDYHRDVLNKSLAAIRQRGYARPDELAYLDAGMQGWDEGDRYIEKQFQARVSAFVEEAKVQDEKHEYLERYYNTLHQLENKKPYPSSEIDALTGRMYRDTKAFDDRIKQIESGDRSRSNIEAAAGRHLFAPLNRVPASPPLVTPTPSGEVVPVNHPKTNPPNPSTQDDDGLPPPPLPDAVRRRCQAEHPEEMRELDAEEKEVARIRGRAQYFRQEADTARRHAAEYRSLSRQATEAARRSERRGEGDEAKKDRERAEKYKSDAEFKEAESESDAQKAAEFEREAQVREGRVRELRSQLLKDCQK